MPSMFTKRKEKNNVTITTLFLNATLFNNQLIRLSCYEIYPIPKELQANSNRKQNSLLFHFLRGACHLSKIDNVVDNFCCFLGGI